MSTIFKTSQGSSQVWRVTKTFRNGTVIHHLLITVEPGKESDFNLWAEDAAYYWAESEPSGQNYGYEYVVELENDSEAIKEAIENECKRINRELSHLIERAYTIVEIVNLSNIDSTQEIESINTIIYKLKES